MAKNQPTPEAEATKAEAPAKAAAPQSWDFTNGQPDIKLDPLGFQIWSLLSRQHRFAEPEKRGDFPHPDDKIWTRAEVEARGIDPDALPLIPPRCCGN